MDSKHFNAEAWRLIKWLSALVAASWIVSSLATASPGEGFEVRGPLKEASSDGRSDQPGYFSIGSTVLMLPPDSVLQPSTRILLGEEVELILRRRSQ
jgi:hypothetical protein